MPEQTRGVLLHEGKSKRLFSVLGPDGSVDTGKVVLHYKDDATAFNGIKFDVVKDKGTVTAAISWHLTQLIEDQGGIRTHLIDRLSTVDHLCHHLEIIPVEVVVRNILAGSAAKRFGRKEGEVLDGPMVEFFYKSNALNDPHIAEEHALTFGWADRWELEFMKQSALKINSILKAYWTGWDLDLVDIRLEFGRSASGAILLADEISPDASRLWDKSTRRRFDKDVFRRDLGDLGDTYRELYRRIFGQSVNV